MCEIIFKENERVFKKTVQIDITGLRYIMEFSKYKVIGYKWLK